MAVHFHKLKVKDIRRETADCVSIAFDIPNESTEAFKFKHGQNITIKSIINGEDIRRTYSICSTSFDNELRIAVKKAEGGLFSTYINTQLKKGDTLEALPPTGKFSSQLKLNSSNKKNYMAFAAGSGITPLLSIIKTTLLAESGSSFTLINGNRSRSSIIFLEELQGLKNRFIERFNFINILSKEKTDAAINSGRIDNEKLHALKKLVDYKSVDEFFICGPREMILAVNNFLEKEQIDKQHIHFEFFSVPGEKRNIAVEIIEDQPKAEQSNITVNADGIAVSFDLAYNSNNILDAALQHGADLPFACKGGVCCSCKAKLVEGEVSMDVNYALEPEEVAQGFILCCQSHPLTKKVVIDFDLN